MIFIRNLSARYALTLFLSLIFHAFNQHSSMAGTGIEKPNIVYIMTDELAYFELSHMGHEKIITPRIDQMAAEGIRFTQALAVSPVCAPLRGGMMTGKHMGHASIRSNGGGTPLRPDEVTIAAMLKEHGYATGGFGKWGAGGRGSTGVPEKHGFDVFFGYYDQVHAHSFYPPYLIRNSLEVPLKGNIGGRKGETYSHHVIMKEALQFIRDSKDKPFFCYLPITPPHGMFDIPKDDPAWRHYLNDDPKNAWIKSPKLSQDVKNYAAMVSMIDDNVGQVIDLISELGLSEKTIVFFTGDNGGEPRFKNQAHPSGYFSPNVNPKTGVEFRGSKRWLYEGGLRIPYIVKWPGQIKPAQVSDHLCYQADVMQTFADIVNIKAPENDGISFLPTLIGTEKAGHEQANHEYLYWEYSSQVAVRMGNWKAIKPGKAPTWELYDLSQDLSESNDIASEHPDILKKMQAYAKEAHEPVRSGSYTSKEAHGRDRNAKWGTAKQQPKKKKNKNKKK